MSKKHHGKMKKAWAKFCARLVTAKTVKGFPKSLKGLK